MRIQPIVEGHGEVEAVPVLLRRLRDEAEAFAIDVGAPIRRKRSELVQEDAVRRAVRLALLKPDCAAILILFDGDDDCPAELGPRVQGWATNEAGPIPCAVVLAHREFEAWFLAGTKPFHPQPETIRDAKGAMDDRVPTGYSPTIDQPSLAASFDLGAAHQRSRSFRRMVRAFGLVAAGAGAPLANWPPPWAHPA